MCVWVYDVHICRDMSRKGSMELNDFMRVTCTFNVASASNPVIMVWDYQAIASSGSFPLSLTGPDIVDAFVARYYYPLRLYLSSRAHLVQVSLRAWADPSDGYDAVGDLWQGESPAAMLPPFVTTAIRLVRANFLMRNGRKAFPGGTVEQLTADGGYNASVAAAIDAITGVWASTDFLVESGDYDITFADRIIRVPTAENENPSVWSAINAYGTPYWGSQNTRK